MRASEFFYFINRKELPTELEREFIYTHITIDENLMRVRRENLKLEKQVELFQQIKTAKIFKE